jgi:hypothetical protein
MRRLYLQIYLAFVGILVLFGVLTVLAWFFFPPSGRDLLLFDGIAAMAEEVLPEPDRPAAELQQTLERLGDRFSAHLAVHDVDGRLLASIGEPLPSPSRGVAGSIAKVPAPLPPSTCQTGVGWWPATSIPQERTFTFSGC